MGPPAKASVTAVTGGRRTAAGEPGATGGRCRRGRRTWPPTWPADPVFEGTPPPPPPQPPPCPWPPTFQGRPPVDDALIDLAARLSDAASAVTRPLVPPARHRRHQGPTHRRSRSPDRDAEAAVRALLAAERPDDGIVGEEHGAERANARHVWVIDPIDGTKAFITGKPTYRHPDRAAGGRPSGPGRDRPAGGRGPLDRCRPAGRPCSTMRPPRTRACDDLSLRGPGGDGTGHVPGAGRRGRSAACPRAAPPPCGAGDCYAYGLMAAGFGDLVIEACLKL